MCIKCWCGTTEASNIDYLSSIQSPSTSFFNPKFSILLPQISLDPNQFSIVNSSLSILTQKDRIFDSKQHDFRQNVHKRRLHHLHRLQLFPGLSREETRIVINKWNINTMQLLYQLHICFVGLWVDVWWHRAIEMPIIIEIVLDFFVATVEF